MSDDPYGAEVRRLFANPEHAGCLSGAAEAYVSKQGVRIRLFATTAAGRIDSLRFQAWGCPHVIAASEAFCKRYEGRAVTDLETFSAHELLRTLSVPVTKTGRILVLEDAVRSLGQNILDRSCQTLSRD